MSAKKPSPKKTMKNRIPKPKKAVRPRVVILPAFVPSPLQTKILVCLERFGRQCAQEIARRVDSTPNSVRDALATLRKRSLVAKSPVSFDIVGSK